MLSPSTAQQDRVLKMPKYAHYGVAHLWLIDPLVRTLEAYQLKDSRWTLMVALKDDDSVKIAPFDAIEFPLRDLCA